MALFDPSRFTENKGRNVGWIITIIDLLLIVVVMLYVKSARENNAQPQAQAQTIEINHLFPIDEGATSANNVLPFFYPQERADGSAITSHTVSKVSSVCTIKSGDELLARIEYYDAGTDEFAAVGFPAYGTAELLESGDSRIMKLLLSDTLGCVISSDKLSAETLTAMASTFELYSGPPQSPPQS